MKRLAALALALTACGDVRETANDSSTSTACLDVPEAVREKIESALVMEGEGTIPRAAAARSPDHERWYYIAAEIDGPGLEGPGHVGVWSSNRLSREGTGMMFAVGEVANGFSDWGDGGDTRARLRFTDPGARAARRCL